MLTQTFWRWSKLAAEAAQRYNVKIPALQVGRSLLALAQLTLLISTPANRALLPINGGDPLEVCERSINRLSAFCLGNPETIRWIFVVLLILIIVGIFPALLSWIHWYIALSIHFVISVPDGGDQAIVVFTFWLALISMSDLRWNAWLRKGTGVQWSTALPWAASWGLRLQIFYIYFQSAAWKLPVEQWEQGTAVYNVVRMENFGATGLIGEAARWITSVPLIALALTWGTILLEFLIAIFVLGNCKMQRIALFFATFLHVGIALLIGIVSFALTMVGGVMIATSQSIKVNKSISRVSIFSDDGEEGWTTESSKGSGEALMPTSKEINHSDR